MKLSREWLLPLAGLIVGFTASRALACDAPTSDKMKRQIGVMEKIVNEVLVESPNFFVQDRETCHGQYIKGTGLVFTFAASLVDKDMDFDFNFDWDNITIDKDDEGAVKIRPGKKDKAGDKSNVDGADGEEPPSDEEVTPQGRRRKEERTFLRGKAELVDIFLDYGDTLTTLAPGEAFVLVGFMTDSDYFEDQAFSRIVLRAKSEDLQSFGSGKLTEEQMIKRLVESKF